MTATPALPLLLRGAPVTGFTDEEFYQFCQNNPTLHIERTATHEVVIMPPAGFESSASSGDTYFHLKTWSRSYRQGRTLDSSAGYSLPDGSVLSPDASWVSPERLAQVSAAELRGFPRLCPDFIIEVKSPSDRPNVLQAKMEQWLRNGVRLAFLIDTETETATIYRPHQAPETVQGFDHDLSGEPVLPGFVLSLRELRAQS